MPLSSKSGSIVTARFHCDLTGVTVSAISLYSTSLYSRTWSILMFIYSLGSQRSVSNRSRAGEPGLNTGITFC